jgi:hypothetical protein
MEVYIRSLFSRRRLAMKAVAVSALNEELARIFDIAKLQRVLPLAC